MSGLVDQNFKAKRMPQVGTPKHGGPADGHIPKKQICWTVDNETRGASHCAGPRSKTWVGGSDVPFPSHWQEDDRQCQPAERWTPLDISLIGTDGLVSFARPRGDSASSKNHSSRQPDNKLELGNLGPRRNWDPKSGKLRIGHECEVTMHDADTNDNMFIIVHDYVVTLHDANTNDDKTTFTDFHNV